MLEAPGFVVVTSVPQIAMADLDAEGVPVPSSQRDNDESVFVYQDEASAHKPGALPNTPQGIPHGANEAAREAFQKWRIPGTRRTRCGVSGDADRLLAVSAVYDRLTEWASGGYGACARRISLNS